MIPQRVSDEKDLVRAASPIAPETSLRTAAGRIRHWQRWLNNRHPYNKKDVIKALKQNNIDAQKLGEYIACSAPLHLTDGWNYLSRAFDAASRGDRSSAYHLAYYAELRAAMSLLATEGIGIFDRRHIALDAQMQPAELRGRSTHRATWLLLEAWSLEADSARRLLDAISLEFRSLSEWLEEVGVVKPAQSAVAQRWLRAWSVDLKILSRDAGRRNEMSYRPTRIRTKALRPVDPHLELAKPLFDSWKELEPATVGARAALDVSLLRQAIELAIKEGICSYRSFDKAWKSLEGVMPDPSYQALKTPSDSATAIFREAAKGEVQSGAATPILARGLLMLRLASASTASLLNAAEISKSDLEFWWAALGTDLGLWDTATDIEIFSDLWIDVAEAKDEASERISAVHGGNSVRSVAGILTRDMSLTQFSRAPMWLLGLD